MADGGHFVDRHRQDLISRVHLVDPILDGLLQENLLTQEHYDCVRSQKTPQNKMRELYGYTRAWGPKDKDTFYRLLQEHNRPLIKDLQRCDNAAAN